MSEQDLAAIKAAHKTTVRGYKALKVYLETHPDNFELITMLTSYISAMKHLSDIIKRELSEKEWPEFIGG
jgi:hypothetical protein